MAPLSMVVDADAMSDSTDTANQIINEQWPLPPDFDPLPSSPSSRRPQTSNTVKSAVPSFGSRLFNKGRRVSVGISSQRKFRLPFTLIGLNHTFFNPSTIAWLEPKSTIFMTFRVPTSFSPEEKCPSTLGSIPSHTVDLGVYGFRRSHGLKYCSGSSDGSIVAILPEHQHLHILDVVADQVTRQILSGPADEVLISADRQVAAIIGSSSDKRTELCLVNWRTGAVLKNSRRQCDSGSRMVFHPSKPLFAWYEKGYVGILDYETGKVRGFKTRSIFVDVELEPRQIEFLVQGDRDYIIARNWKKVHAWNIKGEQSIKMPALSKRAWSFCTSASGRYLATLHSEHNVKAAQIRIFDWESKRLIHEIDLQLNDGSWKKVYAVLKFANDDTLMLYDSDGEVRQWFLDFSFE